MTPRARKKPPRDRAAELAALQAAVRGLAANGAGEDGAFLAQLAALPEHSWHPHIRREAWLTLCRHGITEIPEPGHVHPAALDEARAVVRRLYENGETDG